MLGAGVSASGPSRRPDLSHLDVRSPGQNGLDFQRELAAANIQIPITIINGYGDILMSVRAIRGGAIEFLTKPVRDQDLLDPFSRASLEIAHGGRTKRQPPRYARALKPSPPVSSQAMALVVTGHLNKQIAYDLGISKVTVKARRSKSCER